MSALSAVNRAAIEAVADVMARHHGDRDSCDSELDCAAAVIAAFQQAIRPYGRECSCTGFDHMHPCPEAVLPL
jgi:hypothetical protein